MLIDTHCHLDFPDFDPDRDEVVRRANDSGVAYIINIGSSLEGSRKSLELTKKYDCVYAALGIHPHEADHCDAQAPETLKAMAKNKKVVAIGEAGLDYYKNYSKARNQRPLFISQVELAKELGLPLVIHNREADSDTLKILKDAMPVSALVHCFSGDEAFLKECLELGFFISFTCNITYKKAQRLRDVLKVAPLKRLMLETDAPFLPPEGLRGKRNEPMQVKLLAEEVAKVKEISAGELAEITTANAKNFFNLK